MRRIILLSSALLALPVQLPAQSPWTHLTLSGAGPLLNSTPLVYDPNNSRLIVFGGYAGGPCCTGLSDTWILLNADGVGGTPQWQQLSPVGSLPPGRVAHSAVYDETNNRMIIFSGGVGGCGAYCTLFPDVWVLANANGAGGTPIWTQLAPGAPNGAPAPRAGHRAVYDPTTNHMTIFGGGNNGGADRNDVWVLTNANGLGGTPQWIPLSPLGGPPAGREVFISTYDPSANAMTLFGGCCPFQGDLWILSNANGIGTPSWQQVPQTSPAPGTVANWNYGYDQASNQLIFFGGSTSFGAFRNDLWVLNNANGSGTPAWTNPIPNGAQGSPPGGAPLGAYDATRKRLMILADSANLWVLDATAVGVGPTTGTINATTNLPAATFTIAKADGSATYSGSGTSATFNNAPAGIYTITFGSVPKYLSPPPQTATLNPGQTLTLDAGIYLPVTLSVCPAASPQCGVSLSQLTFSYQQGAGVASSQQIVVSSNAPSLAFAISTVTDSTNGSWLTILPSAAATPATITISVASGLQKGTYAALISIVASGANNSPSQISLLLTVTQGPPPPTGACTPPQSIFADDSGSHGLSETTLSNQRLDAGQLKTDVLIHNHMRFWLTASAKGDSPTNPLLLPIANGGSAGQAGLYYLVPPCATGVSSTPPYLNCSAPGTAAWTAAFCSPGTETITLSITTTSAAMTLTTFLLRELLQNSGLVQDVTVAFDIAQQLYERVPLFKRAVTCAAKGTSLTDGACIAQSLLELAMNQEQLSEIVAILAAEAVTLTASAIVEALIRLPIDLEQMAADLIIYGIQTQSSVPMLGTETITLVGR